MENSNFVIVRKRYSANFPVDRHNTYFACLPEGWSEIEKGDSLQPEALTFKDVKEAKDYAKRYLLHDPEYVNDDYKVGVVNTIYAMHLENFQKFSKDGNRWKIGSMAGLAERIA